MSIYAWIVIIVIVIILFGVSSYFEFHYNIDSWVLFVIFGLGGIFFMTIFYEPESKQPKPIDVYRGKTELEITSVNGVPRDTAVVWKLDENI